MSKSNISNLTIKSLHDHLTKGDLKVTDICDEYLKVIGKKNPEINAYLEVFDDVNEQALRAQEMVDRRKAGPLTGVPFAVKDNILIEGKRASAASKILQGYVATYSATAIKKLQDAGAIFLGRANMDEFAMGSSTENSAFGVTKNPHDMTRVAGGSSGGSAAAVAMGGALAALGSDTAGSVRQPASFCGVVGLKTTYGSVSRSGLIALGSSLDQIGPITKTVADAEIVFESIRGKDPLDSTTAGEEMYANARREVANYSPKSTVLGAPRSLVEVEGMDPDVLENFNASIDKLKTLGFRVEEIELPNAAYSLPAYYIILPGEASANLARFDGVKYGFHADGGDLLGDYMKTRGEGFGPEPRRRILIGTYVLSAGYADAYYNKAQALRHLIGEDFKKAFSRVSAILLPTAPTPAFKIGEKAQDPLAMYLADVFTAPSNIVNIPTISIPSGSVVREGKSLPLGLQVLAPHFREDLIFNIGKDFEGLNKQ